MPKRLLTISEVAERLSMTEEEVKRLVDVGEIPAYRIGNTFLRFRREQIDAIRREIDDVEDANPDREKVYVKPTDHPKHPFTDLEKTIKNREPAVGQYDYTVVERVKDFFYFNDFYIVSFLVIGMLLYVIFRI